MHTGEATYSIFLSIYPYLSNPPAVDLAPPYAKISAGVVGLGSMLVLTIQPIVCRPKVAPTVISTNAIDVVNLVLWHLAGHVEPCHAVDVSMLSINANAHVAILHQRPNRIPCFPSSTMRINQAVENPSFWVVPYKLLQPFLSDHRPTKRKGLCTPTGSERVEYPSGRNAQPFTYSIASGSDPAWQLYHQGADGA